MGIFFECCNYCGREYFTGSSLDMNEKHERYICSTCHTKSCNSCSYKWSCHGYVRNEIKMSNTTITYIKFCPWCIIQTEQNIRNCYWMYNYLPQYIIDPILNIISKFLGFNIQRLINGATYPIKLINGGPLYEFWQQVNRKRIKDF
jgi:hypothetical protein